MEQRLRRVVRESSLKGSVMRWLAVLCLGLQVSATSAATAAAAGKAAAGLPGPGWFGMEPLTHNVTGGWGWGREQRERVGGELREEGVRIEQSRRRLADASAAAPDAAQNSQVRARNRSASAWLCKAVTHLASTRDYQSRAMLKGRSHLDA